MILFRCDAGPQIGFGHLMRCRTLATEFAAKGQECFLLGPSVIYKEKYDHQVFKHWVEIPEWRQESSDALILAEIAKKFKIDAVVLDDYRIGEDYQKVLYNEKIFWAQFESQTERTIFADLIINYEPCANRLSYKNTINKNKTKFLLGPSYSILRREFTNLIPKNKNSLNKHVFINFGAGSDRGAIKHILNFFFHKIPKIFKLMVVSGEHNPNNSLISVLVDSHKDNNVKFFVNPTNISKIMAKCDFAIMGGGTTTFEAARCGLPMILISIADNQIEQARGWEQNGCAIFLGSIDSVREDILLKAINYVIDPTHNRIMTKKALALVDGKGTERIVNEIIGKFSPPFSSICQPYKETIK